MKNRAKKMEVNFRTAQNSQEYKDCFRLFGHWKVLLDKRYDGRFKNISINKRLCCC